MYKYEFGPFQLRKGPSRSLYISVVDSLDVGAWITPQTAH